MLEFPDRSRLSDFIGNAFRSLTEGWIELLLPFGIRPHRSNVSPGAHPITWEQSFHTGGDGDDGLSFSNHFFKTGLVAGHSVGFSQSLVLGEIATRTVPDLDLFKSPHTKSSL